MVSGYVEPLISIHALREEGDPSLCAAIAHGLISIHALREEGDAVGKGAVCSIRDFYPRPPRGGRPRQQSPSPSSSSFLSTPSARRATKQIAAENGTD